MDFSDLIPPPPPPRTVATADGEEEEAVASYPVRVPVAARKRRRVELVQQRMERAGVGRDEHEADNDEDHHSAVATSPANAIVQTDPCLLNDGEDSNAAWDPRALEILPEPDSAPTSPRGRSRKRSRTPSRLDDHLNEYSHDEEHDGHDVDDDDDDDHYYGIEAHHETEGDGCFPCRYVTGTLPIELMAPTRDVIERANALLFRLELAKIAERMACEARAVILPVCKELRKRYPDMRLPRFTTRMFLSHMTQCVQSAQISLCMQREELHFLHQHLASQLIYNMKQAGRDDDGEMRKPEIDYKALRAVLDIGRELRAVERTDASKSVFYDPSQKISAGEIEGRGSAVLGVLPEFLPYDHVSNIVDIGQSGQRRRRRQRPNPVRPATQLQSSAASTTLLAPREDVNGDAGRNGLPS
jgi:hypothetical protein